MAQCGKVSTVKRDNAQKKLREINCVVTSLVKALI